MSPSSKCVGPPTLRSRRREATRLEILEAARQVFAERGYYEVRMDDVAERAGVSVGTLYNYFTDRNNLLQALLAKHQSELLLELDKKLDGCETAPFHASLLAFVSCILEYAEADRSLIAVMTEGGREGQTDHHDKPFLPFLLGLIQRTERLIAAGVARGEVRKAYAQVMPPVLLGAVRGTVMHYLRTGTQGLPDMAGPMVAVMLHGMQEAKA